MNVVESYNRLTAPQRLQTAAGLYSQLHSCSTCKPIAVVRPPGSLPAEKLEKTANVGRFSYNLARFPLSESCTVYLVERRTPLLTAPLNPSTASLSYKQEFELNIVRHEEYANSLNPNGVRSPVLCLTEAEWLWLKQSVPVIDTILHHTKRLVTGL